MTDIQVIEQLIGRFLDGATSNAEEQQLYRYFESSDNIAPQLKKYAPMFRWYAGGMTEPLPQQPAVRQRSLTSTLLRMTGVAAAVLLLAGAGYAYHEHAIHQRLYATYEGSYIIRDGKMITDIDKILPELRQLEHEASKGALFTDSIAEMTPEEIFELL